MIDLSLQKKHKEEDEPVGIIILTLMPFVILFWFLLSRMP